MSKSQLFINSSKSQSIVWDVFSEYIGAQKILPIWPKFCSLDRNQLDLENAYIQKTRFCFISNRTPTNRMWGAAARSLELCWKQPLRDKS